VRIYDVVDKRLKLRLRFRPQSPNPGIRSFSIDQISDIDGNGSSEVLGTFTDPVTPAGAGSAVETATFRRPVVIVWNPTSERYEITPVFNALGPGCEGCSTFPDLRPIDRPGRRATRLRELYPMPGEFHDPRSNIRFLALGTEDHMFTKSDQGAPVIAAAFVLRANTQYDRPLLQVIPFGLHLEKRLSKENVGFYWCLIGGAEPTARVGPTAPSVVVSAPSYDTVKYALLRAVRKSRERWMC
jgi:hypothetical protein